jgi:hypothetical protein
MRRIIVFTWLVAGFFLQAAAYFGLAARTGIPQSPAFSNPRVPFASLVFIGGVIMVFLSAVIYELLPDRESENEDEDEGERRSRERGP